MFCLTHLLLLLVAGGTPLTKLYRADLRLHVVQGAPKWATEEVRGTWGATVPMSAFRKKLQKLRFESDVIDEKEVRNLYDTAFSAARAGLTNEREFQILCLFAYFPILTSFPFKADEQRLINRCVHAAGDYASIEYAFVATCAYEEGSFGKLDLGLLETFKEKAANDPLLAPPSFRLPDSYFGLLPAHKDAVDVIKRLAEKYPLRDEYWDALLMLAEWALWIRSNKDPTYRTEALKYANLVLQHPQSSKQNRETAATLVKEMGGGAA